MMVTALIGSLFFLAAAFVGLQLGDVFADRLVRLPDSPEPVAVPKIALMAACAAIGAMVCPHAASQAQILTVAIIFVALCAIWVTDARCGLVPDAFTLGPLAIIILAALWQHQPMLAVQAVVPAVPFAVAAALSKGRGMGWGDAKLVALGGAVLGAQTATLAFALACLVAVVYAFARRKRNVPIAFAPYLAAAIAVAIPIGILR